MNARSWVISNVPLQGPSAARRTLQSATRPAHERLHTNAAFAALLRGELTRPAYRKLLAHLLGLHEPIEERLAQTPADPLLAWRNTDVAASRAASIRSDLAALGLGQSVIEAIPRAHALIPPLANPASALGCAWVIEGSALGGRVMSRQVDALLGRQRGEGGGSFFAFDPCQPGRWLRCCAAVELCGADPDGLATMTQAAVTTFAAFETWLNAID